jgi:multiple sugar transport system permease protein
VRGWASRIKAGPPRPQGAGALPAQLVEIPARRRAAEGNVYVLPAVALLLLLTLFPFLFTLALTFSRVSLVGGLHLSFAGLGNWYRLLTDPRFWTSLGNTVVVVAGAVSLEVVLGFGLALLLHRPLPGGAFFRVLFIVPMALTPIAVGYMWRMLFNETIGPLNALLQAIGLPPLGWVSGERLPLLSMILVDVWQWTPFVFVLCLAGLQALPEELWEAAQLDGASGGQTLRYVVLPLMVPTLLTAGFLRAVEAFKIVDVIFIITGGGPGTRTESLTLHAYYRGLHAFDLAYGATIAFALFLLVVLASLAFLRLTRRARATEVWA